MKEFWHSRPHPTTSDIDMLLFDMTVSLPDSEIIGYPGTDCAAGSFIAPIDSLSITKYCPAPDAAWRFCRSIIDFQKKNCTYSAADNSYHYPFGLPCTWENFGLLDEQSSHYDHYVSYFTFRDSNGEEHSAYNSRYEKKGSEPLSGGAVLERTEKDTATLKSLIASVDRIKPNDKTSLEIILRGGVHVLLGNTLGGRDGKADIRPRPDQTSGNKIKQNAPGRPNLRGQSLFRTYRA